MTGPLAGRVVLVTRPEGAGEDTAAGLRALGATAVEAPTIAVEGPERGGPLDDAVRRAAEGEFAWVVFTSAAGVRAWSERADALGIGTPRARVAAVGEATAEVLRGSGVDPALVPEAFTTAALVEAFPSGSGRVLLARADLATGELEAALRAKGWDPVRVDAYRVRPADVLPAEVRAALEEGRVDVVTFTSPSTVDGFVRLWGLARGPAIVCIGPVTAAAARSAGFEVASVADPHTTAGLVRAVVRAVS
jgi:uroporphyrinogen-III synthase